MQTKLHYGDKLIYVEGGISEVSDGAVEIEIDGRLGKLKVPMRMLISDREIQIGSRVGFRMSYPELLEE